MRYLFLFICLCVVALSCKKSGESTPPKIKFKSITSEIKANVTTTSPLFIKPILTIQVTDDEGDFGFKEGKDTSYIYIKNISITPNRIDSFKFPEILAKLPTTTFRNYVDVEIDLNGNPGNGNALVLAIPSSNSTRDSLYYEVYVKDFAKNKSNIIKTENPLVFIK
jgi:hypothetical protein